MRRHIPDDPFYGEKRTRKGFLLFPKTIDNEQRWLEVAEWEETYTRCSGFKKFSDYGVWTATKWLSK